MRNNLMVSQAYLQDTVLLQLLTLHKNIMLEKAHQVFSKVTVILYIFFFSSNKKYPDDNYSACWNQCFGCYSWGAFFAASLPVSYICLNADLNEKLWFFAGVCGHIKLIYVLDEGVVKSVGGLRFPLGWLFLFVFKMRSNSTYLCSIKLIFTII